MTKTKDESVSKLCADSTSSDLAGEVFLTKVQKAINLLMSCGWALERSDPALLLFRRHTHQDICKTSIKTNPVIKESRECYIAKAKNE